MVDLPLAVLVHLKPRITQVSLLQFVPHRLNYASVTETIDRSVSIRPPIQRTVDKSVASLDLLAGRAHAKLINSHVLAPVLSDSDMALEDLSLRLELKEVGEVVLDARVVRAGSVADGREQDTGLAVPVSHLLRVERGKRVVQKAEQAADFVLGDGLSHRDLLRHNTRVVVLDLPDSVLLNVVERVASLNLVAGRSHCELVDSCIDGPTVSGVDFSLEDRALRLLEQERIEVVLHRVVVGAGHVGHGGEEAGLFDVPAGDDAAVSRSEGLVPELEEGSDLILAKG